ncbi:hypothetical protein BC624_102238 [Flavobacterium granuli]|uniref:Uncharacterized protein n=1 Tax=Flavobacterium granuli TaxID=280093 RepID=A0A1M5KF69_9FLAO|nr:hypothetical protein BC624_102238 [Flavobacterium granuli]SHG51496.1 hypothetical protein SAMN05443373_102238 [Flavobacterium granuli]
MEAASFILFLPENNDTAHSPTRSFYEGLGPNKTAADFLKHSGFKIKTANLPISIQK